MTIAGQSTVEDVAVRAAREVFRNELIDLMQPPPPTSNQLPSQPSRASAATITGFEAFCRMLPTVFVLIDPLWPQL